MIKVFAILSILFSLSSQADSIDIDPLNKFPKSLFLLKKSRIDNDIGEPVIYPSEKQSELLNKEKVFNKYRLEVIESDE